MDLKHDWKALNEVLFERQNLESSASSTVLLEDGGKIIDGVVSNGKPFRDLGLEGVASDKNQLDALASKYGTDQAVLLNKKNLDRYVIEAAALGTNYYQQLQFLHSKVVDDIDQQRGGLIVSRRHFILDLFGGPLRRVLPRRFNLLLFIDQRPSQFSGSLSTALRYGAILLTYSSGKLEEFYEPDFSSLHENRLTSWQLESKAIGQYLESRYILPCYAIFMYQQEWERCLGAANAKGHPWRQFVRYYDEGLAAVYPNQWLAKALLATQRLMVYFGRL